ncbi:MAG: hypothetical protein H6969_11460 [Gammaproteobacteria bacterium]|nr:hypothetical protein [Gammaproteobacteria bacterium]
MAGLRSVDGVIAAWIYAELNTAFQVGDQISVFVRFDNVLAHDHPLKGIIAFRSDADWLFGIAPVRALASRVLMTEMRCTRLGFRFLPWMRINQPVGRRAKKSSCKIKKWPIQPLITVERSGQETQGRDAKRMYPSRVL